MKLTGSLMDNWSRWLFTGCQRLLKSLPMVGDYGQESGQALSCADPNAWSTVAAKRLRNVLIPTSLPTVNSLSRTISLSQTIRRTSSRAILCAAVGASFFVNSNLAEAAFVQWEETSPVGQSTNASAPPRAMLQPIQGLGKQISRSNDGSTSNKVPALSIGFRQESLPPSKQQSERQHASTQEIEQDREIIKLLKPLPIQPKNREVLTQRYPDGKIQTEREVKRDQHENYLNDGKWKRYHTDGRLMGIGRFEEGQMVGLWKRVHFERDSQWFLTRDFQGFEFPLISSAEFKDGEMHGLWVIKDSQERKIFELNYENGRRNGSAIWWYPTGEKRRQLNCKSDLLHGQWQEWDESGKLVRENWFREGHRIARNISYFRENRPETEQSFLDPKLELVEADDWWNAKLGRYEATGEAVQEGPVRAWYDNGQRHMAGFYKENAKDGEFAWWHPNGTRKLQGSYKDGLRTGKWIWWHENGIKAAEIEFDAGTPVTDLLTWDEQGIRQIQPQSVLSNDRQSTAKPPLEDGELEFDDLSNDGNSDSGGNPDGIDDANPEELPGPKESIDLLPKDRSNSQLPDVDDLDLIGGNAADQPAESATTNNDPTTESPAPSKSDEAADLPPPRPKS